MKTVFSYILTALLLTPFAVGVTFSLDSNAYPDVTDHHCIAYLCAGFAFPYHPHGFHRDLSPTHRRQRRHAVGCDKITKCGIGHSCDEIPYASTFDGGLGCFSQDWTGSGRNIGSLYRYATHRCVQSRDNSAHGSALNTFYQQMNIPNYQEFNINFLLRTGNGAGGFDPRSHWCVDLFHAVNTHQDFGHICKAAESDGTQYRKVTASQYQNNPRCPSRNYRQGEPSDDIALAGSHDDNLEVIPARNVTADTVQVATLENGFQVMSLFGTHQVGDEVWMHDDTLQNGIISKVAKVGSLRDVRADCSPDGLQKC